ncbi:hypothetical protein CK203_103855 [Vitis vinifera]|uniref:Uncharacterized protein n=1 Tax=Vitis vinifera TaxID=29760 RepID=A0A438C6I4_VITVI|nr:hypothetical protein CK203_103855 [Vitis vinifera]
MESGAEAVANGVVMAIKRVKFGHSQTLLSLGLPHDPKVTQMGISALIIGVQTYLGNLFQIAWLPNWWHKLQARKKQDALVAKDVPGRAAMTTTESELSLILMAEPATSTLDQDHMTFDPNDFSNTTQPRRTCIANANGATYLVTGAGIVPLSPSLSLAHTLLDVLNKKIIGCGTKRRGLYSLDDFSPSKANHMHHQTSSHAKFGYGKALGASIIWLSPASTPIFIFPFVECGL